MKRTILLSVAAGAAAVIAVGVVFASGAGHSTRTQRINLSVFDRSQRRSDRLPGAFRGSDIASHFRDGNSRRVGRYHGTTWWAVPGTHHTICLAGYAPRSAFGTFGPCTDARALADRAIVFAHSSGSDWSGKNLEVAGLANDGLTRAQFGSHTKKIRNNAFFFTWPDKQQLVLRLTGAATATHVVRLHNRPVATK